MNRRHRAGELIRHETLPPGRMLPARRPRRPAKDHAGPTNFAHEDLARFDPISPRLGSKACGQQFEKRPLSPSAAEHSQMLPELKEMKEMGTVSVSAQVKTGFLSVLANRC